MRAQQARQPPALTVNQKGAHVFSKTAVSLEERRVDPDEEEAVNLARDAYRTVMGIKRLLNIETKYWQITGTAVGADNTGGTPVLLNNVTVATTDRGRLGDSIKLQGLSVKWRHTGQSINATVRCLIVNQPTFYNIATAGAATSGNTALMDNASFPPLISPAAFKDWDNKDQFKILYDKTSLLQPYISGVNRVSEIFEHKIKLDFHTQFDETATPAIVPATGALWIFFLGNTSSSADNRVDYVTRLFYTDD